MYCSGCGSQLQTGLNYCSRCGRRVAEDGRSSSGLTPTPPIIAAFTAGAGFFCYMLVLRTLSKAGVPPNQFIPISFVYFASLFGICVMILRYGSNALKDKDERTSGSEAKPVEQTYLAPSITAQLTEPSERPASVTEHTTRALDGIPVDRH
ncbi:MAG TPA: hypothetical protein PKD26_04945 [Pyrinomonadaceae bacterium]|nr:hypothetical protein [Pyrinomonadaceae bacterium]